MDDKDFFDLLFQQWCKTTGAEHKFWMPEQFQDQAENKMPWWTIWAVGEDQHKHEVASDLTEDDADWITAVHGCFGDLVRRMHQALDESDRLDCYVDEQENRIANLEQENSRMEGLVDYWEEQINEARISEREANSYADHLSTENAGLERELEAANGVMRDLQYQLHEVGL